MAMNIPRQLYQLQELDQLIADDELALGELLARLGDDRALQAARANLADEQQRLDGLHRQQRSAEDEIEDIESRIRAAEKQLYGGKVVNPKELANLQQEVNMLQKRRDRLETQALEIIELAEAAAAQLAATSSTLAGLEDAWQREQQQLSAEIERLKSRLGKLNQQRRSLAETIDPAALACYQGLKKQKGLPVARVEQGICRGCRISLSLSKLQQVRSGTLVQCGQCGRILFLP